MADEIKTPEVDEQEEAVEQTAKNDKKAAEKNAPKVDKSERKPEQKNKKKAKKKEPGKVRRWFKDFWSELKKVTWPTFAKVLKQTGTVLLVTVCFLLVVLAFDSLLGFLYRQLLGGLAEESVMLMSSLFSGGGGLL